MVTSSIVKATDLQPAIDLVINGLDSPHSRDAYRRSIQEFLTWWHKHGRPQLKKAVINEYKGELMARNLAPSTVNQKLSAIRKLAKEAADNGMIDQETANGIAKVKGVKSAGVRTGNWLTKEQAQILINTPDLAKIKGLRDRAILCVAIGCGLRRAEISSLKFEQIQMREARWVIVDMLGKSKHVRTVPMPSWCKVAIDAWAEAAGIQDGLVFRGVYHGGYTMLPGSESITAQAVHDAIKDALYQAYKATGDKAYLQVAPHDLRRTYARLAYKGGSGLDQVQLSLGHLSIRTTEKYLGVQQSLTDAPCDHLGLDISGD